MVIALTATPCCFASHATTPGSGRGRISSERTLVSASATGEDLEEGIGTIPAFGQLGKDVPGLARDLPELREGLGDIPGFGGSGYGPFPSNGVRTNDDGAKAVAVID